MEKVHKRKLHAVWGYINLCGLITAKKRTDILKDITCKRCLKKMGEIKSG